MRGARGGAAGGVGPGTEDGVTRGGGGVLLGGGEEFSADEPADGALHGTLGNADGFGHLLIADADFVATPLLLGSEPEIDEKGDGAVVVAHEVAKEDVHDVVVEGEHAIPAVSIATTG